MDTSTPDTTSESILFGPIEKLSNGNTYVFFAVLVLIFTVLMMSLAFVSTTETVNGETGPSPTGIRVLEGIGIAILTIAVISVVLLLYLPSLKSVLQLVDKLRGAIFVFVFIFALIIFYRNISATTITNYRIIIVPIIAWMSMKMFRNAMTPSTEEEYTPNLQIEKMRVSLVYVALVSFVVLMYSVDFGGFLREYLGPSVTATRHGDDISSDTIELPDYEDWQGRWERQGHDRRSKLDGYRTRDFHVCDDHYRVHRSLFEHVRLHGQ
jgi:small-conductance mechanosensitive channel